MNVSDVKTQNSENGYKVEIWCSKTFKNFTRHVTANICERK